MILVENQVSDLVRLTVFLILGWPGNIVKIWSLGPFQSRNAQLCREKEISCVF